MVLQLQLEGYYCKKMLIAHENIAAEINNQALLAWAWMLNLNTNAINMSPQITKSINPLIAKRFL